MSIVQNLRRRGAQTVAAVSGLGLSAAVMAQTVTVPSSVTMVEAITAEQGDYAAAMFALALAAVGILVGVKWIKRARGAA